VTSAVEAVDDHILERLDKGHTRDDLVEVVDSMREVGLALAPTVVAFTPWTTIEGYLDLLDTIDELGLVEAVAPIQLAIRLLIPQGSRLLELNDVRQLAGPLDPSGLVHPWRHPDERVDGLQRRVQQLVGRTLHQSRTQVFDQVKALADEAAGVTTLPRSEPRAARATVPYLTEPWYC